MFGGHMFLDFHVIESSPGEAFSALRCWNSAYPGQPSPATSGGMGPSSTFHLLEQVTSVWVVPMVWVWLCLEQLMSSLDFSVPVVCFSAKYLKWIWQCCVNLITSWSDSQVTHLQPIKNTFSCWLLLDLVTPRNDMTQWFLFSFYR